MNYIHLDSDGAIWTINQPEISIEQARAVIRKAFEKDGGNTPGSFKHGYISNMAMLLHDRYDVSVKLANEQAIALLDLIFAE